LVKSADTEFGNDKGGYRVATSVGGYGTGAGGSMIIVDDPHNVKEAPSKAKRADVLNWWTQSMSTRINPPKKRGIKIVIMQRCHEMDLAGFILANSSDFEHLCIPAEYDPRRMVTTSIDWEDPRELEGEILWPEGFNKKDIKGMKAELGSYGYCTPYEAPILMSDLSLKPIGEVKIGDEVVGFTGPGTKQNKCKLIKTIVKDISVSKQKTIKLHMRSGRVIRCTPNHKWANRRWDYRTPKVGNMLRGVCLSSLPDLSSEEEIRKSGWLSGFFDADGSFSTKGQISFSQSNERNKYICDVLEEHLRFFGFDYSRGEFKSVDKTKWSNRFHYYVKTWDRMAVIQKFLHIVKPTKWKQRIIDSVLNRNGSVTRKRDFIKEIEEYEEETVYGLTTETGNYIVWGYASSNSAQFQQTPTPPRGGIIHRDWWRFWDESQVSRDMRGDYNLDDVIQSWDMTFKGVDTSDYVVGQVWGRVGADKFLLDQIRRRMSFTDTLKAVKNMVNKWPETTAILVEDKANGPAIISQLQREISGLIPVNPQGDKVGRLQSVSPQVESGNVWLPRRFSWVDDYVEEFASATPDGGGQYWDQIDATSQALLRLGVGRRKLTWGRTDSKKDNKRSQAGGPKRRTTFGRRRITVISEKRGKTYKF
jgi:predicted phage terminase large subunit-like protein